MAEILRHRSAAKSRTIIGLRHVCIVAGLILTQLTGCFTVGQEFSATRITEIKIGQTRKQDVLDMLGRPWRTGLEDGYPTWTYGIYQYSLFGAADTQDLLIRFDNQGVVRSYNFSSTRH